MNDAPHLDIWYTWGLSTLSRSCPYVDGWSWGTLFIMYIWINYLSDRCSTHSMFMTLKQLYLRINSRKGYGSLIPIIVDSNLHMKRRKRLLWISQRLSWLPNYIFVVRFVFLWSTAIVCLRISVYLHIFGGPLGLLLFIQVTYFFSISLFLTDPPEIPYNYRHGGPPGDNLYL